VEGTLWRIGWGVCGMRRGREVKVERSERRRGKRLWYALERREGERSSYLPFWPCGAFLSSPACEGY
jgi:hypothetical protein